jgi:hypothetical protein
LDHRFRAAAVHGLPVPSSDKSEWIQGTTQLVDYQRRELSVIADGRAWRFVVPADCRLVFNDRPACLRCVHSLDPVMVIFRILGQEMIAEVIYSWDPQSNGVSPPPDDSQSNLPTGADHVERANR